MTARDDRLAVLVGVGTVAQRAEADEVPPFGVHDLMARAAERALADTGADRAMRARLDAVLVPRGTWQHPDPGREMARRVGAAPVRSIVGEIGVLQHSVIATAIGLVESGDARAVAVVGGEAMARRRAAGRAGVDLPDEPDGADLPGADEVLRPVGEILPAMEIERHLGVPVHQYALIESVLAHRAGEAPLQRAARVAGLWAAGSQVAAGVEDAWVRSPWTAGALAADGGGNRMLATPYRRWCVSDWTVDQAACLLITSVGEARGLGIDPARWVAPVATGETNHMVPLSARDDLAGAPAWRMIGEALADATGWTIAGADHLDLYSCFPSAVAVAAAELGIDLAARPWTVTGGMTFGGGPLNSYVLHATAELARRLRAQPGSTGATTGVSGLLTKVAAGTWQSGAPAAPLVRVDVSDRHRSLPVRELVPDLAGPAVVCAATVVHDRGRPARAIAIVEDPAGRRCVALTDQPAVLADWCTEDPVGRPVTVDGNGVLLAR